jgi:hypothetical protein
MDHEKALAVIENFKGHRIYDDRGLMELSMRQIAESMEITAPHDA